MVKARSEARPRPRKSAAKTAAKTSTKAPTKTPAKTPAKTLAKTPAEAPAKTARVQEILRLPMATRVQRILELLEQTYPEAKTALHFETPLELLVATILSAQCTDERVNQVTPALFRAYPTAAAFARAPVEELERMIHSCGFFRAKAKAIQGSCRLLVEQHAGKVPRAVEELIKLPGVARKTANVVLGSAYGIASGIAVDTHVQRVAQRLALTSQQEPGKIEQDLMQIIPQSRWIRFSHELILHGRTLCHARRPKCRECPLASLCPAAEL